MELASESDHEELQALYLRQWNVLRAQLRKRTGSSEIADDALQETWIRVANLAGPPIVRDRQAFLFRIAANIAIDLLRRERRHRLNVTFDDVALSTVEDLAPSPEKITIDRDQLRQLVRALMELPERPRTALLMSRCDGASHKEIASRLGVSESMVAKYLAQSLRHCRDIFRMLEL
jgi:RNA polymerase sigma factor (sigma-70 family)